MKRYASISWTTKDVMEEAASQGVTLDKQQAETLLKEAEEKLKADMLAVGWMVISRTIREGGAP
jgi:methionine-rich copper-binding protein CopC